MVMLAFSFDCRDLLISSLISSMTQYSFKRVFSFSKCFYSFFSCLILVLLQCALKMELTLILLYFFIPFIENSSFHIIYPGYGFSSLYSFQFFLTYFPILIHSLFVSQKKANKLLKYNNNVEESIIKYNKIQQKLTHWNWTRHNRRRRAQVIQTP